MSEMSVMGVMEIILPTIRFNKSETNRMIDEDDKTEWNLIPLFSSVLTVEIK